MTEPARAFASQECVACGLCLEVCPTYLIRRDEGSGPRGRIRLMEQLRGGSLDPAGQLHIEECVGCLACQAHCPAGAPFGEMLDGAHERLGAQAGAARPRGLGLLAKPRRLRRLAMPLRLLILSRLPRLIHTLGLSHLPGLGWLSGLRWLPRRVSMSGESARPHAGAPFLRFPGCVGGLLYPQEQRALGRVLSSIGGFDDLPEAVCCGAVHRHLGALEEARELARTNIAAGEAKAGLVVTAAAGCGAALKEYGRWLADDPVWAERAARFSERVRDLSELLLPEQMASARGFEGSPRVAYDDPCHAVHAQGIAAGPRALLDAIPGLERVELAHPERCCGAGGTYFLRQPELSLDLAAGRVAALRESGARILLTANPGCRLQWEAAIAESDLQGVRVRHPVELWAEALDSRSRG